MQAVQFLRQVLPTGDVAYYAWFSAMHTRVDLLFLSEETADSVHTFIKDVRQRIAYLEHVGNCFDPASELSQLLQKADGQPVQVSDELFTMLSRCLYHHQRTFGLFDISIDTPGFSPTTLQSLQLVPPCSVCIRFSDLRLNLSGFLKGYALDRLSPLIQQFGVSHALISMGNSSIMALGRKPGHEGWPVRQQGSNAVVVLHDECLTTSGNNTADRCHIRNPRTGQLVTGQRTVAVRTATGTEGEVLSTALFIADDATRSRLHENYSFTL